MSTPEAKATVLRNTREGLFERLTSILDFMKAQPAIPNLKKVKARYDVVGKIYDEYNVVEHQIIEFNAVVLPSEKIPYKKERKAVDEVLFEITELHEELTEAVRVGAKELPPNELPKMKLPKFSGNFRQWSSFKAVFESMVHSTSISNVQKFQRLRECLDGEPQRMLEHFTLSAENYPLAYQALLDRYDNPRIAANTYLNALLSYKPSNSDSHMALQNYLIQHYDSVKSFKNLNIPDHYDYLLFKICHGHLDKKTQRAFDDRHSVETFPTYEDLMQFVQNQLRKLELNDVDTEQVPKSQIKHSFNLMESNERHQTTSHSCYVCDKSHPLIACPKFLNLGVAQRYEILKKHHLCFNCFRQHQRNACTSEKKCKKCARPHHTLLHSNGKENERESTPLSDDCPKPTTSELLAHTVTHASQNSNKDQNLILLGTARGFVNRPGSDELAPVRILLDSGSQVSCISADLAEKLCLQVKPKITNIKGVSGTAIQSRGRADCNIFVSSKRKVSHKFSLLVLPAISTSLPKLHVHPSVKERFRGYRLADPTFDEAGPADILIGADYFYDLITDQRIIRGKPNGVPTVFGLVLSGEIPVFRDFPERNMFSITVDSLDQTIMRSWEKEEVKVISPPQDDLCETFCEETTERTSSGRCMDDPLPPHLQGHWNNIVEEVQCLSQIRIPRYVPVSVASQYQVIGFCDASEKGFAAVLYIRCIIGDNITVHLLGGKTKVAPVKPITIPRLELNAAHLLSKLYTAFKPTLEQFPVSSTHLFSDSQVVLGWLRTPPHKLKTYVCNRIVEILNLTSPNFWGHVSSEQNAADCASRGLEPQHLLNHPLWWEGPDFLHQSNWELCTNKFSPSEISVLPELKQVHMISIETHFEEIIQVISKFSSLSKLFRVVAYILRFIKRVRHKSVQSGPLKLCELRDAAKKCIWVTQGFYLHKERDLIKAGAPVPTLKMLTPFLDQNDLVRVGGRLGNAPLPYESRHPLLVPHNSSLARLIVSYYHQITLHGGPQLTRSAIQTQYWIPKVGTLLKSVIFACKSCRRQNPKPIIPIMGELPPSRFDQVRPFLRVGTDFAGPFTLKETPRRKAPLLKAYVCLFVCFSTKAVHLEIVTSLSTEAFLAAFDRFTARRGLCAYLYSDNGTNFTGAARKISEVSNFLSQNANHLEEQFTTRNIQWLFNPPTAPHFGGLWEAAVKSFKHHLNRVTTSHLFTLEEFSTLACRIEAILNSRPLCPLTSNQSDSEVFLTPGHFLVGASLVSVPELPLTDLRVNTLSRWQLIGQCVQNFWKTWSNSYLHTMLPRKKWQFNQGTIKVGDVVFLRNEKTNPLSWPLARVEQLCEGKDGVCRVVKIRCNDRILTRPVHTLIKVFENNVDVLDV